MIPFPITTSLPEIKGKVYWACLLIARFDYYLRGVGIPCVGHGANHCDSSGEGRGRARREVLFVDGAGIAEMHVHVDEAGQADDPARGDAVDVCLQLWGFLSEDVQGFCITTDFSCVFPIVSWKSWVF